MICVLPPLSRRENLHGTTISLLFCITKGKVDDTNHSIVMMQHFKGNSFPDEDPELEREFRGLAQWLLDVYLWRLEQERRKANDAKTTKKPWTKRDDIHRP
jgi:hypothetical protein